MTVGELIKELREFPDEMQVIVPSDDGRALGFGPDLRLAHKSGELYGRPLFRYGDGDEPLLLITLAGS